VVDDQDQRVLVGAGAQQLQPDRPLRAQVERRRRELRRARVGVGAVDRVEVERVVAGDDLDGALAGPVGVHGAQDGVAPQEAAQRRAERGGVERPGHADEEADVVGGALGERAVVQPHALLRVGQGGGAAGLARGGASGAGSAPVRRESCLRHHPPHQFAPQSSSMRRRRRPLVHASALSSSA
jgi:hypothetical protein